MTEFHVGNMGTIGALNTVGIAAYCEFKTRLARVVLRTKTIVVRGYPMPTDIPRQHESSGRYGEQLLTLANIQMWSGPC